MQDHRGPVHPQARWSVHEQSQGWVISKAWNASWRKQFTPVPVDMQHAFIPIHFKCVTVLFYQMFYHQTISPDRTCIPASLTYLA